MVYGVYSKQLSFIYFCKLSSLLTAQQAIYEATTVILITLVSCTNAMDICQLCLKHECWHYLLYEVAVPAAGTVSQLKRAPIGSKGTMNQ